MPLLLDSAFDIKVRVDNLDPIVENINELNKNLSLLRNKQGKVDTLGLVCVDIFQFMHSVKLVKCMNGSAWELFSGLAPFGDVNYFLYDHQRKPVNLKTTVTTVTIKS